MIPSYCLREHAPSYEIIRRSRHAHEGHQGTEDASRYSHSEIGHSPENIEPVKVLLEWDWRMSCKQMADLVGISPDSIHKVLIHKLNK